ncbi:hypothetical protein [Natrinema sp. H-ect4]|uniref:hypothetical protein n=1 Tax=Natrinema sp. H-ect4 TaxID=3242699 RepID=UPI0035A939FC
MIRSAELDDEHLTDDGGLEPIVWVENAGYPVDILERYPTVSVKEQKENTGYLVTKIGTLSKHPNEADAVEDEIETYVCHCWNFVTEHLPKFNEGATPADISACKHIESVDKSARAMNDQGQQQLADTPVSSE